MTFEDTIRQIIREETSDIIQTEISKVLEDIKTQNQLKPFLTREEMMELFHIGPTKATELLKRPDFPVFREAGVLIPTEMLLEWVRRNTRWVERNTSFINKAIS